ncbi:MAG: phosphoribosylformylglycinamidine cyclo-ligase [Candidatus Thermoplasmatota archaeon]|nr:phosphoribosylformylglycinamidine cyclo-ligase [Candidatus Thermoplasmatota archaeon]
MDRKEDGGMTYRKAGVDIEAEGSAIRALVRQLTFKRQGWGSQADLEGHFTGLIDFGEWYLSMCTDGVGTKIRIAEAMGRYDTIGIDCMAMNVNDMICIGAEPLAFVDYIACENPTPELLSEVGKGLNAGAEMANVSLIGGETATLPDMVKGLDLAGTCLGAVRKGEILDSARVDVGDLIIGLPSSGLHSNGFTLVRRIIERSHLSLAYTMGDVLGIMRERAIRIPVRVEEEWGGSDVPLGEVLLEPTRIYVRDLIRLLGRIDRSSIKGIANITGGGLRNICRLRHDIRYSVEDPLEVHPVFELLQVLGGVDDHEMYQTFNMGMGMSIICHPEASDDVLDVLGDTSAKVVGRVIEGTGVGSSKGVYYVGYV